MGFESPNPASQQMSLGASIGWNFYKRMWLSTGGAWIFYDKIKGLNKDQDTLLKSTHPKDHFLFFSSLSIRF